MPTATMAAASWRHKAVVPKFTDWDARPLREYGSNGSCDLPTATKAVASWRHEVVVPENPNWDVWPLRECCTDASRDLPTATMAAACFRHEVVVPEFPDWDACALREDSSIGDHGLPTATVVTASRRQEEAGRAPLLERPAQDARAGAAPADLTPGAERMEGIEGVGGEGEAGAAAPHFEVQRRRAVKAMLSSPSAPFRCDRDEYGKMLAAHLAEPFDEKELGKLLKMAKEQLPKTRYLETRRGGRDLHLKAKAASYFDRYPEMARELSAARSKERKLTVLRNFFFWLEHIAMPNAYVPWMKEAATGTDCVVMDGPDPLITGDFCDLEDAQEATGGDPGAPVEQEEAIPRCGQGSAKVKLEPV